MPHVTENSCGAV